MKLLVLFLMALVAVPTHSQLSIDVDHTSLYQEFYGCGASWTDSSAWLMYGDRNDDQYRSLTDTERDAIFSDLFGSNGIALKVVRQPMGTSDFRWSDYTFQDDQGTFSIARDKSYIIPTLARTLVENDKVKVMALPWSPPAWMKQNGSLYGGSIKSDAYDDLAQYFVDFVQAYEAEGIPIWAVSIQNEPMHESNSYPTMGMTESQHAQAIVAVRAALDNAIKVVGYDHNWDTNHYPKNLLDSYPDAKASLSAIAYHCYASWEGSQPDSSAQTELKNLFPELDILFTECTEHGDVSSFNGDFRWALGNLVIGATRNWASTVLEWNLVLDNNHGPKIDGGCSNCRGLIDITSWDEGDLQYEKRPAYYALGHMSKFAAVGARRIDSSQPDSTTRTVAMMNPDDSALLIILNDFYPDKDYSVNWFNMTCPVMVPSWSAVTLFRTSGSPTIQVWATYDHGTERLTRVSDVTCTFVGGTAAPVIYPTPPSPVAQTPAPVAASPSPAALTAAPTSAPTSPTPTASSPTGTSPETTGVACCSQNGVDCLHEGHYCGSESQCGSPGCEYVFWLPNGVPIDRNTCTARFVGGCDTKACCPGLGCVSDVCSDVVTDAPTFPTPSPVAPTLSPVIPTLIFHTSDPTSGPTQPPTPSPTTAPTSSTSPTGLPTESPTISPTSNPTSNPTPPTPASTPSPIGPQTPAPVDLPTSDISTTGIACCSQDGISCLHPGHFCEHQSMCGSSGCEYVFWLENGVPTDSHSCTARYQGGCDAKECCPGLTCTGSGSCQLI